MQIQRTRVFHMPANSNPISWFEFRMICGIWDLDDEIIMATDIYPGADMVSKVD
jgi:hypothetical protein